MIRQNNNWNFCTNLQIMKRHEKQPRSVAIVFFFNWSMYTYILESIYVSRNNSVIVMKFERVRERKVQRRTKDKKTRRDVTELKFHH